jgi:hypothetical protein
MLNIDIWPDTPTRIQMEVAWSGAPDPVLRGSIWILLGLFVLSFWVSDIYCIWIVGIHRMYNIELWPDTQTRIQMEVAWSGAPDPVLRGSIWILLGLFVLSFLVSAIYCIWMIGIHRMFHIDIWPGTPTRIQMEVAWSGAPDPVLRGSIWILLGLFVLSFLVSAIYCIWMIGIHRMFNIDIWPGTPTRIQMEVAWSGAPDPVLRGSIWILLGLFVLSFWVSAIYCIWMIGIHRMFHIDIWPGTPTRIQMEVAWSGAPDPVLRGSIWILLGLFVLSFLVSAIYCIWMIGIHRMFNIDIWPGSPTRIQMEVAWSGAPDPVLRGSIWILLGLFVLSFLVSAIYCIWMIGIHRMFHIDIWPGSPTRIQMEVAWSGAPDPVLRGSIWILLGLFVLSFWVSAIYCIWMIGIHRMFNIDIWPGSPTRIQMEVAWSGAPDPVLRGSIWILLGLFVLSFLVSAIYCIWMIGIHRMFHIDIWPGYSDQDPNGSGLEWGAGPCSERFYLDPARAICSFLLGLCHILYMDDRHP